MHLIESRLLTNVIDKIMSLKHSIYGCRNQEICLFVKDPEDDIRSRLESKGIEGLTEIMGLKRLRDEYRRTADKRNLAKQYDLFLADERIIPMLHTYLGKSFFLRKKHPFKVNCKRQNLAERICVLRDSTYLHIAKGPTRLIRVGWSNWEDHQLADNIEMVLDSVPIDFTNISQISLKTASSPNFPIFNLIEEDMEVEDEEEDQKTTETEI